MVTIFNSIGLVACWIGHSARVTLIETSLISSWLEDMKHGKQCLQFVISCGCFLYVFFKWSCEMCSGHVVTCSCDRNVFSVRIPLVAQEVLSHNKQI